MSTAVVNCTIDTLLRQFREGIWVLETECNRNSGLWPTSRKQNLILSILEGVPVPALYFIEDEDLQKDDKYHLVDGLQRVSAIQQFLADEFRVCYPERERLFSNFLPLHLMGTPRACGAGNILGSIFDHSI